MNKYLLTEAEIGDWMIDYKAIAQAQLTKAMEMVLERIGEDFVEMVANFYMNEGDKRRTFELWQSLKARILKEMEVSK